MALCVCLCVRSSLPRMISIPSTLAFGDRLPNLSSASLPSLPSFSQQPQQQQPPPYSNGPDPAPHALPGPSGVTTPMVDSSHMTNSAPSTPLTPASVEHQAGVDPKVEVVTMPQACDMGQPHTQDFTIHTSVQHVIFCLSGHCSCL